MSNQLFAPLLSLIPAGVYAGLEGAFRPDPALRNAWRRGPHIARTRGDGSDFHEHRHYEPGDDLRRLDWRAIARHDKNVVRETQREVLAPLLVVLDAGGSMAYGSTQNDGRDKWSNARSFAAALLTLVRKNGDPIGALVSSRGKVDARAARSSLRVDQIQRIADGLASPSGERHCEGPCDWPGLFLQIQALDLHNTTLVIVSDFLDFRQKDGEDPHERDRWFEREITRLRSRALAVQLVQILHRDELTFPFGNGPLGDAILELRDPHELAKPILGQADRMRENYLREMREHLDLQHRTWTTLGLSHVRHITDETLARSVLSVATRNPIAVESHTNRGDAPAQSTTDERAQTAR